METQPFTVRLQQAALDDLVVRLGRTRWPAEIDGAGWDYGTALDYMRELVEYWHTQFDWRAQERDINAFAHFRATIDGFGLHFIHERGQGPNPLPIVLLHGWPDSFHRFHKIIPHLTDPASHGAAAEDSFDVVVPSLPGYGFSDRPRERDFGSDRSAAILAHLMTDTLGYARFAAHGGDIGSGMAELLAKSRPEALIGVHLTDVPYYHMMTEPPDDMSDAERAYLEAGQAWQFMEGAYALVQATKPQTLAFGLTDSPAGLAAWIVEKFRAWSDCDGDVERRFTKDELLTNITIYWATQTIGSSFLPYYASQQESPAEAGARVETPTGVAIFPKDIVPAPREFAARYFNLQRWTEMPRGGHFAALEEPQLLVEDIRAFFRPLRAAR